MKPMTTTEQEIAQGERRYAWVVLVIGAVVGAGLCWTLFPDDATAARRLAGGAIAGFLAALLVVGNRLFE